MELILGDIRLNQQNFDEAIKCYKKYIADYPSGSGAEKAQYRSTLALIFAQKYPEAKAAIAQYLTDHPSGIYVADAEYRLAVIDFSNKEYDKTLADCTAWEGRHAGDDEMATVLSLVADCDLSTGKTDDAIDAYLKSSKLAKDNKVLSYSLFSATKLLQKARQWDKIIDACNDFIQNDPDNVLVVSAVGWIGRAKIKLGKIDEARNYMQQAIKKSIDDPTKDGVDDILLQLAQISRNSTTDVGDDLLATLSLAPDVAKDGPVVARIAYLRQQVAHLRKQSEDSYLAIISKQVPDDLSSRLLGLAGDYLREHNQPDGAKTDYRYLLDSYPTSESVDYAYNGFAQLAYDAKDYTTAAKWYTTGLDSGLSVTKTKDLTLGMANSMLNLNKLDDAKQYFEQVASNRDWRGEDTAYSVYSLGKIEMLKGNYKTANAYFQRVYVAYQRYPHVEAKAYMDSAKAFEQLGMYTEAQNTYRDMLTNSDKMADCPELQQARQRLGLH